MRRLLCAFFLLPLLLLSAFATENNDFFNAHAADCVYDGREYQLNGTAGYVAVLAAPYGEVQDYLLNEQPMTVYGVYTDSSGVAWAQLRYSLHHRGLAVSEVEGQRIGWLPMSELCREMDKSLFLELHKDEFVNLPLKLRLSGYPDTTLWLSPLSSESCGYLRWYVRDENAVLSFPAWWKDENGLRWALWEDYFLCLDEPERTENSLSVLSVVYPSVPLDALPLVVEQSEVVLQPSPLPYYFIAAAVILVLVALGLRLSSNSTFNKNNSERK